MAQHTCFVLARHASVPRAGASAIIVAVLAACHAADTAPLPAGIQNPSTYSTPSGATQLARGTVVYFRAIAGNVIVRGGELTDEMTAGLHNGQKLSDQFDLRDPNNGGDLGGAYSDGIFAGLSRLRGQAQLARGALRKYVPDASPALIGAQYAMEGYADIYLADMFCSGIPLSTVQFEGDFTYEAGSTTAQVYQRALALFDSAAALAVDSDPVLMLARAGKARALLALGQFDSSNAVAAKIPTGATSSLRISQIGFAWDVFSRGYSEADREGIAGLPYVSSNDPRTAAVRRAYSDGLNEWVYVVPTKADSADSVTVTIANGIEARLIEAEADLKRDGTQWLPILNTLRTSKQFTVKLRTGTPGVDPGPAGYPDTTWGPGTGTYSIPASVLADTVPVCNQGDGVNPPSCTDTVWYRGLAPLSDPGTTSGRVDLLFRERAFWLYFTGHRQGDLRRLLRQYPGRTPAQVYPTGVYERRTVSGTTVTLTYGDAVNLRIPPQEATQNRLYKGCVNRAP